MPATQLHKKPSYRLFLVSARGRSALRCKMFLVILHLACHSTEKRWSVWNVL